MSDSTARLFAYGTKVAKLLVSASAPMEAISTRQELRTTQSVEPRLFAGRKFGSKTITKQQSVAVTDLHGWLLANEITWYEEKYYNSGALQMEESTCTQIALSKDGRLLSRRIEKKHCRPSGPAIGIGRFAALDENMATFLDYSYHQKKIQRKDSSYRVEGWTRSRGRTIHTEPGKGLSIALTNLRRTHLGE